MSRVVTEELITTLTQPMRILRPLPIAGLKPYILAASPSIESITFKILKDSVELFSKTLTFEEIKEMGSTTENNWHGFVPFKQENVLYLYPGDYEIVMSANGYTYSKPNFVGWCKDQVCYFGNIFGTPPSNYTLNPYSYRLIEFKPREN